MSVTQNYTITMSGDVWLHIVSAVTTQLIADRSAQRVPGEEYDEFLLGEIAIGAEALVALAQRCKVGVSA